MTNNNYKKMYNISPNTSRVKKDFLATLVGKLSFILVSELCASAMMEKKTKQNNLAEIIVYP